MATLTGKTITRGIYLIADFSYPAARSLTLLDELLVPGIALLQYRDKQADKSLRLQRAQALKTLCADKNVPLIINDDVQLAVAVNADGVHLGESDMPLKQARAMLGKKKIIGVSCYQSLSRAQAAYTDGADYAAFGALFASATKPEARQISLQNFADYCQRLKIPVCAIGGITCAQVPQVLQAGADLVAVISHIWQSDNPKATLETMLDKGHFHPPRCHSTK